MAAHSFISWRAAVIHEATHDHLVVSWERCLAIVWRQITTVQGVFALDRALREQRDRYHSGLYLLTVVEETAALPDAQARDAVARFLRSASGTVRMSAVVHEGTGFRAAAVRSVVTAISHLARLPYPHEIFATVEQAAAWLGSTQLKDVDPDHAVLALAQARRSAAGGAQPRSLGK